MIKKTEAERGTQRQRETEKEREGNPNLLSPSLSKSTHARMTDHYCSFVGIALIFDVETKRSLKGAFVSRSR